ncbi:hypothetical protein [[Mycoplasma] testudinis]|uniref:hypothetical protein n=1 Tax=[Mycoplasma] testudinis TaxID=33924 RepID=UPI0012EC191B|nr:hypothetical protein [[Mycoplasma] testudinis]
MIRNAIKRLGPYPIRKLVINSVKSNILVGKIKSEKMLLEYCGLDNETQTDKCFLMLSSKFTGTFLFKKTYLAVYCNVKWDIIQMVKLEPNKIVSPIPNSEYVFIMSPNLANYLNLKDGDQIRIAH